MSLNSIEVLPRPINPFSLPASETPTFAASVAALMREQMEIAAKATDEINRLQEEVSRLLGAEYWSFLEKLEAKAPAVEKLIPHEALFEGFNHTWRIKDAGHGLERAISKQMFVLGPIATMFDRMEGKA